MSNKTTVIYTAVFGNYDEIPLPPSDLIRSKYRCILITDHKNVPNLGWEVIQIQSQDHVLSNRHCKMFPWKYFEAESSFYLDGRVYLDQNFEQLYVSLQRPEIRFAALKHRSGGLISDELVRCIDHRRISKSEILAFLNIQPDLSCESIECGFLYRVHECQIVRQHAEFWWRFFNDICRRDQLLVNEAALRAGLQVTVIKASLNDVAKFVGVGTHKRTRASLLKERIERAIFVIKSGLLLK